MSGAGQKIIAIGSSTGGPGHIQKILSNLPKDFNASIVIGQHINPIFLESIADNLKGHCKIPVLVGRHNMTIDSPCVVFAKGAEINELKYVNGAYALNISSELSPDYSPSIDRLFSSIANLPAPSKALAVLLTGIGEDGARGLLKLKNAGAHTIAESEKTAVVYGMPRAACEIGAACQTLALDAIINKILEFGR